MQGDAHAAAAACGSLHMQHRGISLSYCHWLAVCATVPDPCTVITIYLSLLPMAKNILVSAVIFPTSSSDVTNYVIMDFEMVIAILFMLKISLIDYVIMDFEMVIAILFMLKISLID